MKELGWKMLIIAMALPILLWCAATGAASEVRLGWLDLCDDWSRANRWR